MFLSGLLTSVVLVVGHSSRMHLEMNILAFIPSTFAWFRLFAWKNTPSCVRVAVFRELKSLADIFVVSGALGLLHTRRATRALHV